MSLKRDTLWTAADALVAAGLAFAFRLFVARILVPEDFGIAAMALTVIILLQVVIDLGFNAALIQKDEDRLTQRLIDSTFTASLIVSLGAAALTAFVIAPAAAYYYAEPAVRPLIAAAAIMLLPWPFSTVAGAMMRRGRRFKALAAIRVGTVLCSIVAATILLLYRPGPWVVVGQAIAASVLSTIGLLIASPRRYRLALHREDLREVFGFSGFVAASGLAGVLSANAGVLVLGRLGTTAEVGLFSFATYVVDTTRSTLMAIFTRVTFVHFAQAKHDTARLRELYLTSLSWACRAGLPACVAIALFGPVLSVQFLGPEWAHMASVLPWLALASMAIVCDGASGSFFQAVGRPQLELKIYLLTSFAMQIPLMLVGALVAGLEGLAIAVFVVKLIATAIRQYWLGRLLDNYNATAFRTVLGAMLLQTPLLVAWVAANSLASDWRFSHAAWLAAGLAVQGLLLLPDLFPQQFGRFKQSIGLRNVAN